jgi:predicted lipoprotein with Yx(FWY)xxD motif
MITRALSGLGFAVLLVLAACGGSGTGSTGSSSTPTPAPTPTPTPVVESATATVAGTSMTILTDAHGMTVYYYTPDKGTGKATCTDACLQNWPAVITPSGVTQPTGDKGVTGTLGTITSSGGSQVTYNGWPLYTFIKDKSPGDTTGQGVGGKWFVVTPTVASGS